MSPVLAYATYPHWIVINNLLPESRSIDCAWGQRRGERLSGRKDRDCHCWGVCHIHAEDGGRGGGHLRHPHPHWQVGRGGGWRGWSCQDGGAAATNQVCSLYNSTFTIFSFTKYGYPYISFFGEFFFETFQPLTLLQWFAGWKCKRPSIYPPARQNRIFNQKRVNRIKWATQLSDLWWIPNSVSKGFDTAMKTGSSIRLKRYPTTYMWVSSWLPFTED